MLSDLREVIAMEENPALITLQNAAKERGIDILCDDDAISLGHGKGSKVWEVNSLPNAEDVDWDSPV